MKAHLGHHYRLQITRNNIDTMKICIVSDSHDRAEPLAAAVAQAKKKPGRKL